VLTLAVFLVILGLILTVSWGLPGFVVGPCLVIIGLSLFRQERRRRQAVAAQAIPAPPPVIPRRPGWQRFLIVAGCIAVGVIGVVTLAFRLTAGLPAAVDGFFSAMRDHDLSRAKSFLAEDFRASTTDSDLDQFIQRSALTHYSRSSWSSRTIQNNRGSLEGTVYTNSGGAIPMNVSLIKEQGQWKVYSIRKPQAGLSSAESPQVPTTGDQVRLLKSATHALADAVARKDFTQFHANVAGLWQRQTTPETFRATFQSLIDSGGNFLVLDRLDPSILAADLQSNGVLALKGRYSTTPKAIDVSGKYLYEGLDWKLVGMNIATE
jgi:hypothetical protein